MGVAARKSVENITDWLKPSDTVLTLDGMISNAQFCHEEAARQRKLGNAAIVKEHNGMIATLHPEAAYHVNETDFVDIRSN